MKKGVIIAGVIALLAASAVTAVALAKNDRTRLIQQCLKNPDTLSALQQKAADYNHDEKVNYMDLIAAKIDARLGKDASGCTLYTTNMAAPIGRTYFDTETNALWCALSGSGIAFDLYGECCDLTLLGDSACTDEQNGARYAVYVNGKRVLCDVMKAPEVQLNIQNPTPETSCAIQIIKLSESMQSTMGFRDILVTASKQQRQENQIVPAAPKEHRIEFIGDSITCGYGVDGVYGKDVFKTSNEDATQAYAIRTAQALNADYSLVSYSGHGILSGYTGNGKLNKGQLVPRYYTQIGHSYGKIDEKRKIQDYRWDFSIQPDLVVLNLGTNDASYTGSDAAKQQEFISKYVEFLKTIRENNPDAPILCCLGIMGTTLCDAVDTAVMQYTAETGDHNIRFMPFEMQSEADGYAVDWHPSAITHQKAADKLSGFIKDWLGW